MDNETNTPTIDQRRRNFLSPGWTDSENLEVLRLLNKPDNRSQPGDRCHRPGSPNWKSFETDPEFFNGLGKTRSISSVMQHYHVALKAGGATRRASPKPEKVGRRAKANRAAAAAVSAPASNGDPIACATIDNIARAKNDAENFPSFCPHCGTNLRVILAALNLAASKARKA